MIWMTLLHSLFGLVRNPEDFAKDCVSEGKKEVQISFFTNVDRKTGTCFRFVVAPAVPDQKSYEQLVGYDITRPSIYTNPSCTYDPAIVVTDSQMKIAENWKGIFPKYGINLRS